MNYYNPTNYYPNYPTYNNFNPNQYIPQTTSTQSMINGKIVDSQDMVKATEVPIGSYGVFPKADLSEIYIKSWNNNGTTNIVTFKPILPETPLIEDTQVVNNSEILEKIKSLEDKLDSLIQQKKESVINAY